MSGGCRNNDDVPVGCRGDSRVARSSGDVSATEIDRLRQSLSVFLSPEKEKLKKERAARGMPPRPPLKVATPPPHEEAVGRGQYRSHNADRSEFRLLNVMPRTILGFPSRGRLSRVVPRGSPSKQVLPRTRKLSPLCTPFSGGLGGRSRIEPRILIISLSAGANRGSLRGAVP